ncbi:hypothetical protein [Emcibacter nanhaiensis]|uniref:MoaD/ThiS family protein n=1 Tax=Emcibacter nanhaiensis TaxID=1505037 RepID=A0A501PMU5_9PROT|nr:hypothetical protein [Emcibacter nanhaiensis]TPD61488.1 hypothetical protein FIV46_04585 [Emcibacter nanhaiensis]
MSKADEAVAILRVSGSECTLPLSEVTIDRFLAEARAVGLEEFSVYCNGEEVHGPADLLAIENAIYVIAPPDEELPDEDEDEEPPHDSD